jgi:outer membrane protein TolC
MLRKTFILLFALIAITLPNAIWAAADQQPQPQPEILTLDQCLDLAYQNSPSLKAADKSAELAKLQVREAGAGFWPTVNYSITGSNYTDKTGQNGYSNSGFNEGFSATQKLYTGGLTTSKYQIAKFNLENALEEQRKAKQQMTFNVKQAYYQVWLAKQMLEVTKSSYKNAERRYQQQKAYYEVGNASKVELLQAQVQWESMRPQVINSQNQLDAAMLNFTILIGIDRGRLYTVNVDLNKLKLPENVNIALAAALEDSYKNRPDVREMKNTVEIGKLNTKMAYAGYKPILTLTGSYTGINTFERIFNPLTSTYSDPWTKNFALSLNFAGVVFDGLATQTRIAEAKKNEELIAIRDSSLKDQVQVEIELAIQSINANLATARASQTNIDLAKESLRLTQAKYDAGMATNIDITDAQLKLDQALNGYYSGLSAYLTAQAKLDLVTGKDI